MQITKNSLKFILDFVIKLNFLILQIILFSAFMLNTNHKIIHVTPLKKIFWHGKTFNYTINEFLSHSDFCFCFQVIIICIVVFNSIVWKLIFHLLRAHCTRLMNKFVTFISEEGCWQWFTLTTKLTFSIVMLKEKREDSWVSVRNSFTALSESRWCGFLANNRRKDFIIDSKWQCH